MTCCRNIKIFDGVKTLEDFYNSVTWKEVSKKTKPKKRRNKKVRRILVPLCFILSLSAYADNTVIISGATIEKVSVNNKWHAGGCLAYVSPYAGSKWCAADWVSLNCDEGKDSRPLRADFMLKTSFVAMMQRNLVDVTVNQSKIVNGFCSVDEMVINKEKAVE